MMAFMNCKATLSPLLRMSSKTSRALPKSALSSSSSSVLSSFSTLNGSCETAALKSRPPQLRAYSFTTPRYTNTVKITYVEPDGTEKVVDAKIGEHLLDAAHNNDVELEGACGGDLACSTCHLIFEKDVYDTLPEKEEDEDDMLDLAYGVEETSRLGCQIRASKELDGIKVRIPEDGL